MGRPFRPHRAASPPVRPDFLLPGAPGNGTQAQRAVKQHLRRPSVAVPRFPSPLGAQCLLQPPVSVTVMALPPRVATVTFLKYTARWRTRGLPRRLLPSLQLTETEAAGPARAGRGGSEPFPKNAPPPGVRREPGLPRAPPRHPPLQPCPAWCHFSAGPWRWQLTSGV